MSPGKILLQCRFFLILTHSGLDEKAVTDLSEAQIITNDNAPTMTDPFNYTTIFAPLGFFIGGIILVLLLNRFIGKSQNKKTS